MLNEMVRQGWRFESLSSRMPACGTTKDLKLLSPTSYEISPPAPTPILPRLKCKRLNREAQPSEQTLEKQEKFYFGHQI